MRTDRLDRRALLRGLGAVSCLSFASGSARAAMRAFTGLAPETGALPPALVLLQLSGGNDGLSTVVPYAAEEYRRARAALALPEREVRPLDGSVGLHPNLARLHELFERGRLAVVQGAGYPDSSRSHFESLDVWHAADARGRAAGEGWIGRLQAALFGFRSDPNRCVHVGGRPPYSVRSSAHPAASFTIPAGYRWVDNAAMDELASAAREQEQTGNGVLDSIRAVASDARASSLAIRSAVAAYRPRAEYPTTPLGNALRAAAALLDGRIGTRVVSVETGGFDTHSDQRRRHAELMADLDAALGAFAADIDGTEVGRAALLVAFSEFGRRVAPNASGGTDHGKAGPVLLLGESVRGCVLGAHPSLEDLDQGDLRFSTDFRSVYATVIEGWFGARQEDVLETRFPVLPLLSV